MLELNEPQSKIAMCIGVSQATISKELKRNSLPYGKHNQLRKYVSLHAQRRADIRKGRFVQPRKFTCEMAGFVYDKLTKEEWSPAQIVGYARKIGIAMVSVERIYQYIRQDKFAGGRVYKHCRHRLKHRKRSISSNVGSIPNRVSIHSRPMVVSTRERFGDWEMDLIQGKNNTFILTMVERQTRYLEMLKLPNGKQSLGVTRAVKELLDPYKEKVMTITTDNGSEFSRHERIAKMLNTTVYFADPYCSWQKGTVENTNKLIRQYIPKETDFNTLSDKDIQQIENKLNNRPRKVLGFEKPADIFFKHFYNFGG
jgi:IS30 family transposase